jgi:hypothetical protein
MGGRDAAPGFDGPLTCTVGQAASEATTSQLNLFGTAVYFHDGNPLPAGTYTISYVDGCMKYGAGQGWTVNAYAEGGCCGWWVIGDTTSDHKLQPPGTIGYAVGSGAFESFEDCVTASKQAAARTFTHAGGKLGVWLEDSPYTDNAAGEGGRNPTWKLELMGDCADAGLVVGFE